MGRRRRAVLCVCTWGALACTADMGEVRGPAQEPTATPTVNAEAGNELPPPPPIPDTSPPRVQILYVDRAGDFLRVAGTALDDRRVVALHGYVGFSGPTMLEDPGNGYTEWQMELPALAGPQTVRVEVFDGSGHVSTAEALYEEPLALDIVAPQVFVDVPQEGFETGRATVVLRGRTSDNVGVAWLGVEHAVFGPVGMASTADHFRHWALAVPLQPSVHNALRVMAVDVAGNTAERTISIRSRTPPPHEPPRLEITSPPEGTRVDVRTVDLVGTVQASTDDVMVSVQASAGAWVRASVSGGRWHATAPLRLGSNLLRVVARDGDGLFGEGQTVIVYEDGWGDGPHLVLRGPGDKQGELELQLDRGATSALFPSAIQESTRLMVLDPRPLMRNALAQIRDACGADWRVVDFEPQCPSGWGAAERNLWRLLTMTPATADVSGTNLERIALFADLYHRRGVLPVGFRELLARALDLPLDEPLLADDVLVEALVQHLIASHPNTLADGRLPITLRDGLSDLSSLASRFGREGEHPGFIEGRIRSEVLTPAFRMRMVLASNLRFYEGVDLDAGRKTYMADRPVGEPVVEMVFGDPERFQVVGLAPEPRVDLRFGIVESPQVATPSSTTAPMPRGSGSVWSMAPWRLERIVAEAAFAAFSELRAGCDLCGGVDDGALLFVEEELQSDVVEVTIGRQGYDCFAGGHACTNGVDPTPPGQPEHFEWMAEPPAGWFRLWAPAGLVQLPPPGYIWDTIVDVTQARLRDGGVGEGEGSVTFDLQGVASGLSAADVEQALRVHLQAQREDLAEALLGGYAAQNAPADLLVERDDAGALWLLVAACGLPISATGCRPVQETGIYATPDGGQPLHRLGPRALRGVPLADVGDGAVLYVSSRSGALHRLHVEHHSDREVALWLRGARQ